MSDCSNPQQTRRFRLSSLGSVVICALLITPALLYLELYLTLQNKSIQNIKSVFPIGFPLAADFKHVENASGLLSTFRRVSMCLSDTPWPASQAEHYPTFSEDGLMNADLYLHFNELVANTRNFRGLNQNWRAISEFSKRKLKYGGPFVEDHWVMNFSTQPLHTFGGLIPIFGQWNQFEKKFGREKYRSELKKVIKKLRKDVIYVTVSQTAEGWFDPPLPNVFVFSSGGFGHVAIPLLARELPVRRAPPFPAPYFASFAGSLTSGHGQVRMPMKKILESESKKLGFKFISYNGDDWISVMQNTSLNLAPRGYGRTSFRLGEIIQMGFIPVYVWDDHEWLPYRGSPADVNYLGWSVQMYKGKGTSLKSWLKTAWKGRRGEKIDKTLVHEKRRRVLAIRDTHFTFRGVMQQISYFLLGDTRSDLVCQRHPKSSVGPDRDNSKKK